MCEKCAEKYGWTAEEMSQKAAEAFTIAVMDYVKAQYYERSMQIRGRTPDGVSAADYAEAVMKGEYVINKMGEMSDQLKTLLVEAVGQMVDLWIIVETNSDDLELIRDEELRKLILSGELTPLAYFAGLHGASLYRWLEAAERADRIEAELFLAKLNGPGGPFKVAL